MAETRPFDVYCAGDWNDKGMEEFNGDFAQARRCFARALALEPFNAKYYHNHGRKNLSLDHFEEALADFTMVMRLEPEDDDSCHYRGVAYFFLKQYEKAIECFMKSIELMLKNGVQLVPPTVDWAWMSWMRLNQPDKARALLDEYIYPDIPCGESDMDYKRRTLLYKGLMTPESFEAAINTAEDLDAITCYYGLANYYRYVAGDMDSCRAWLDRTLAVPTAHNAFAYKQALLDKAALEVDAPSEPPSEDTPEGKLEAYLRENPADHEKWFELGQLYFDTNFQRARECFSMALSEKPFEVKYRFNRGRKGLSADDFEEALADFIFSVRLDPRDGFKWHYVGNAYFFLGMYDDAIENYTRARDRHLANGIALVPPAVDWIWMCYMRSGRPEKAREFLMANTTPDIPVVDSDLSYKKRILLYAGYTDIDTYLTKVVSYADQLDAITEVYGAVNYYHYITHELDKADKYLEQVLSYDQYHHCFGYKLALIDKAKGWD